MRVKLLIILIILIIVMGLLLLLFFISSSFIIRWILLECTTLSFLRLSCIRIKDQKFRFIRRYFLIQVIGSSLLLISLSLISSYLDLFNFTSRLIYNFSLCIKIGLFPFHMWVVNLVSSARWLRIYLLGTIQKVIPLLMLR